MSLKVSFSSSRISCRSTTLSEVPSSVENASTSRIQFRISCVLLYNSSANSDEYSYLTSCSSRLIPCKYIARKIAALPAAMARAMCTTIPQILFTPILRYLFFFMFYPFLNYAGGICQTFACISALRFFRPCSPVPILPSNTSVPSD